MNEMIDLRAHGRELARALSNFHVEPTEDGRLYFAKQKLYIGGVFAHSVNGLDRRIDENLFVDEGLMDVLTTYFVAGTQATGFYIAPFINNVAPVNTLTAATFNTTMGEFTAYTNATRPQWTPGTPATNSVGNSASPANFVLNANGSMWGMAMFINANAKTSGTGKLAAATQFAAQRTGLLSGDTVACEYDILAQSA